MITRVGSEKRDELDGFSWTSWMASLDELNGEGTEQLTMSFKRVELNRCPRKRNRRTGPQ